MARERMVTRTVDMTTANCITMDIEKVESDIKEYELSGIFTDNEQLLKALKKLHETNTFKIVAIKDYSTKEVLYGMTEVEFIKKAKALPPRGTKVDLEEQADEVRKALKGEE